MDRVRDDRGGGTRAGSSDPWLLALALGGSVAMLNLVWVVLLWIVPAPGMDDGDASRSPPLAHVSAAEPTATAGTGEAASGGDVSRIAAPRALDGLPLAVGKARADVPRPFEDEERWGIAVSGALSLALLVGIAGGLRALRRQRRREALLVAAHAVVTASETRYRLIADNAADMIVQSDRDGRRLYVSPASYGLLGRAPEDLLGTRVQDGMHPGDVGPITALIDGLARGDRDSALATYRLRHADGRWIWVEGSIRGVCGGDGRFAGCVATLRDVCARQAAEQALRASEARYRALADALPQIVWVAGPEDGEATYVNRRFEAYFGPLGRSRAARLAHLHPDDAAAMSAAWGTARAEGRTCEVERRLRRHDGVERWHKIVMIPMHRDGRIDAWLGTALDVDEIIVARGALEQTTDLLRLAQEAAGAGTWDLDLVRNTVVLSPESIRLHGLADDHPGTMGFDAWLTIPVAEDAEHAVRNVATAIASRRTFETEFRVPHPNGALRWIQGMGRTYYDDAGNAVRMTGLNFDITPRKDAEAALRLAKTRAETARAEAERASAAKSEFLAAMSHEIRTPLNAVIGFTDLLASSERLAPDLLRHAELARSAGGALLTIVDDILDFSKIEAGRIALHPEPFSLAALVGNCLSIVRGEASAKALDLRHTVSDGLPPILVGDEARLRQVLLNLLINAIKFTRSGTITLSVTRDAAPGSAAEAGEPIRFAVADTGVGIPQDEQHRLFERFSQIDGSMRQDLGGTGLGLAISKRLVEAMGGAIGAVSREGHGSTFAFTVVLPTGVAPSGLAAIRTQPTARRPGRLLLVEDVPINQELARVVLEAAGHSVDVVGDGAAAVAAVAGAAYDLVLMDVQMPGMDGMTAARAIRRLPGPAARVPIIAMTANVLPDEVRRCRAAGMNDHVGKPFNRGALYAQIDRWLRDGASEGIAAVGTGEAYDAFDRRTFDEVVSLLGAEATTRLLEQLADELGRSLRGPSDTEEDLARLRRDAHVLVSAAGMLGFTGLGAACARFETCDPTRSTFAAELAHVRARSEAAARDARRLADDLARSIPRSVERLLG